jgi:uncharacterized protein
VRFWDTSAIVPLLLEQAATAAVVELLAEDPAMVVWWGTPAECASAAARLRREEVLTVAEEEQVLALLARFQEGWVEVLPSEDVRRRAMRLLRIHSLKAADALQLAAAQLWAGDGGDAEIVTFDERVALAARMEGFRLRPRR